MQKSQELKFYLITFQIQVEVHALSQGPPAECCWHYALCNPHICLHVDLVAHTCKSEDFYSNVQLFMKKQKIWQSLAHLPTFPKDTSRAEWQCLL